MFTGTLKKTETPKDDLFVVKCAVFQNIHSEIHSAKKLKGSCHLQPNVMWHGEY